MPYQPRFQTEGIASCAPWGVQLKWLICANVSAAVGMEKGTRGRIKMDGCAVRKETGDRAGGTTLPQNAAVIRNHGVKIDVYTGANVASPFFTAVHLQGGRGFMLSGNLSALIGTRFQSNRVGVNHTVWVNEAYGGTLGNPEYVTVYDPMANGRTAWWGKVPYGPQKWPWALLKKFAAALRPWGDADSRTLGPGKFYCIQFPDVEGAVWGPDVSAAIRARDPDGRIVGAAIAEATGRGYGDRINMVDLQNAISKSKGLSPGHGFGTVVDPVDVQTLIEWAVKHKG